VESIALDTYQVVLEIDLLSGEERLLRDDEPFPADQPKVARIATGDRNARKATDAAGAKRDSVVRLRIPSIDQDSDRVFEISLWFYSGDNPLVLISGPEDLPLSTLAYLLIVLAKILKETDWSQGRYLELARKVKNLGLWILNRRIRGIEQSVRGALDDENFSPDDYSALRDYPARLALVETAARKMNEARVEWESARPRLPGVSLPGPIEPDPLPGLINEAADDARGAVTRLSGLISSQQIVLTQRQAAENQRFQRVVTIVGAAVLVPGLVAAIFGANVGFHGRGSAGAFWAMLLLMAGSGIVSYALIRSFEIASWEKVRGHRSISWFFDLSAGIRLGACAALGLAVLGVGIALLIAS
jgi:hypothetical protein